MTPIDFGGGMIFPNSYGRDQPDGPDPCDECEGTGVDVVQSSRGPYETDEIPCWRCHGTGQV
jgi:DnaJ-class molecular chaperone